MGKGVYEVGKGAGDAEREIGQGVGQSMQHGAVGTGTAIGLGLGLTAVGVGTGVGLYCLAAKDCGKKKSDRIENGESKGAARNNGIASRFR